MPELCPSAAASSEETSSSPSSSAAFENGGGGNVDRVLFKNLVEIVPLIESLIDQRENSCYSSFTRRASVVYTPTPAQLRKVADPNGKKTSAKKQRSTGKNANLESSADDFSISSSSAAIENIQRDREELTMLREQVDVLQKKLLEKDEALKSSENSINQMSAANASLGELRNQVVEKDSSIKSMDLQLYNAKIKLADKQAALEKLAWESDMSNKKVEELQGNVVSMELEVTALMKLFEELVKNDSAVYPDVDIDSLNYVGQLPQIDDMDIKKMEDARTAYMSAVAAAKADPCEESMAAAAEARLSFCTLTHSRLHLFLRI